MRDGEALIEDLGSRHGFRVDGARVQQPTPLRHGSKIELGSVSLAYRVFVPAETDSRDS